MPLFLRCATHSTRSTSNIIRSLALLATLLLLTLIVDCGVQEREDHNTPDSHDRTVPQSSQTKGFHSQHGSHQQQQQPQQLSNVSACDGAFGDSQLLRGSIETTLSAAETSTIGDIGDFGSVFGFSPMHKTTLELINVGFGTTGTKAVFAEDCKQHKPCCHWTNCVPFSSTRQYEAVFHFRQLQLCLQQRSESAECETRRWMDKLRLLLPRLVQSGLRSLNDNPTQFFYREYLDLVPLLQVQHSVREPLLWVLRRIAEHDSNDILCDMRLTVNQQRYRRYRNIHNASSSSIDSSGSSNGGGGSSSDSYSGSSGSDSGSSSSYSGKSSSSRFDSNDDSGMVSNPFHILECMRGSRFLHERLTVMAAYIGIDSNTAKQLAQTVLAATTAVAATTATAAATAVATAAVVPVAVRVAVAEVAGFYADFNRRVLRTVTAANRHRAICVWDENFP